MIRVQNVGHVVLKVRDLDRSTRFYRDVLGLREVARGTFGRPMVFFSSTGENHHDLALFEVGPDAPAADRQGVGLYHVALRIGHSLETLREAKTHLETHGITRVHLRDHRVSQSIYLEDPDGHGLELYVDADPSVWRRDPSAVASSLPLEL
jgi:catechol-2,3-dioxygenase